MVGDTGTRWWSGDVVVLLLSEVYMRSWPSMSLVISLWASPVTAGKLKGIEKYLKDVIARKMSFFVSEAFCRNILHYVLPFVETHHIRLKWLEPPHLPFDGIRGPGVPTQL